MTPVRATSETTRDKIVRATTILLTEGGREAVSTRAVSAAAGVQAPAIYRLFGDKQGLLDAVAADVLAAYVSDKASVEPSGDPIEDLRTGWDSHVGFGLANPALYVLYADPRPDAPPPAAIAGADILAGLIHRIAAAGRLRVSEERAVQLVHAAGTGTTLTLIAQSEAHRDPELSDLARESVIAAITTDAPTDRTPGPVSAAIALRAGLGHTDVLTPHEGALMRDWLDRIAAAPGPHTSG